MPFCIKFKNLLFASMKVNEKTLVLLWVITWNSVSIQASAGILQANSEHREDNTEATCENETKEKSLG